MIINLETTKIKERPTTSLLSLKDKIKQEIIDCSNEQTENTKILIPRTCIVKNQYGRYIHLLMKNMSKFHLIKKVTQHLHYYSDLIKQLENEDLSENEVKQLEFKIDNLNEDNKKFAAELIERNIEFRLNPKLHEFVIIDFKDILKRV